MKYDIPGMIKNIFGFLQQREEKRDTRYYQKTIKRLRKAVECGERFIGADDALKIEQDPKERARLNKEKIRQKKRFRGFN